MAELMAEMPQGENKNPKHENNPLLYSDATYNIRRFIFSKQSEVEILDKSYGDGSSNEICAVELNQAKIDELANDYRAKMCVSHSNAIRNESHKETVKNDDALLRNEDESRCKSNRKRKMRRKMPKGIIINLSKDIYDTSQKSGVIISVIFMHNLIPKTKSITISRKYLRSLMQRRSLRNKTMNKMIDSSVLTAFCTENCGKIKKSGKSAKRKCKNRENKLTANKLCSNVNTSINTSNKLKNRLNKRKLHVEDNLSYLSNEILDNSTKCCYDNDNASIDIDNTRYLELNAEQTTCVNAKKYIANHCCSIFNDERQEYHICDREDYNANVSDFNAEMRADWTTECFHPECIHAGKRRCFHDSSKYYLDINMQHDCCSMVPMQTAEVFKNSALSKKHQREVAKKEYEFTNIMSEFSTNGYSSGHNDRCANCDRRKENSIQNMIQKCIEDNASKTSMLIEPNKNIIDLCNVDASTSRYEIDTRSEKCGQRTMAMPSKVSKNDEHANKSDSLKTVDTWDARRNDHIGRRCVVAESSSRSDRSCEKKEGFAPGMDSEWKQGSIETDVQQLDYKWKRRIATVNAGTHASVDCKEKRDSRSQTRSDNTNVDGKHCETRDYSLWTSLQMGKIWSQVHDACKNVVKSVGHVVRNTSKSEHLQRNLEITDAILVENSSSSCANKICEVTRDKNLTCSKSKRESEVRFREHEIGDVNDVKASMRQNSRTVSSSRHKMREQVRQNVKKEKNEKSCVFYREKERDGYQDVIEFLPRNETYGHDENIYPQSHLSESFTYPENSAYLGLRNRGGSDDGQDSAQSIEDKQKSIRRTYEESRSRIRYHRNCTSKKCACCSRIQELRERRVENQNLQHTNICHESSVTTDRQTIRADMSDGSRRNPLHQSELQSKVSIPKDNKQRLISEQTRSCEKIETYENSEYADDAEIEGNLMSKIAEITHATRALSTDPTLHSSRNDPDKPIASTSKWETPLVSSGKSQKDRSDSRSLFCTTTMKFWRKRPIIDNKIIASFKQRNVERKKQSSVIIHDNRMKIMQIEPSTVQIIREDNKKRSNINIRLQISDATVAKILSKLLVSDEMKKKMLMNITLESESDNNVLNKKEVETQTSLNDIIFTETDVFRYSDRWPQATIAPTSKIVPCFVCDKRDCYEIKRSNNSITLENVSVAEYPEISELNDHFAKRKTDIEIPP